MVLPEAHALAVLELVGVESFEVVLKLVGVEALQVALELVGVETAAAGLVVRAVAAPGGWLVALRLVVVLKRISTLDSWVQAGAPTSRRSRTHMLELAVASWSM